MVTEWVSLVLYSWDCVDGWVGAWMGYCNLEEKALIAYINQSVAVFILGNVKVHIPLPFPECREGSGWREPSFWKTRICLACVIDVMADGEPATQRYSVKLGNLGFTTEGVERSIACKMYRVRYFLINLAVPSSSFRRRFSLGMNLLFYRIYHKSLS